MNNNKKVNMRLQREARMAKKDYKDQIKKHGKIVDNFICLPDLEDAFTWYFIIWGIDEPADYMGGYYIGQITCPPEYPAKAPNIKVHTDNGRFRTHGEGICLSISNFHPESWNPAWKVNHVVLGLQTFWPTEEYTYGNFETHTLPNKITQKQFRVISAMKSREHVLNYPKFKETFSEYAEAIGIQEVPEVEAWKEAKEWVKKIEENKRIAEEKRKAEEQIRMKEAEQKKMLDEQRLEREERRKKQNLQKDFFKKLAQMGLTQYVGKPNMHKQVKNFFGQNQHKLV